MLSIKTRRDQCRLPLIESHKSSQCLAGMCLHWTMPSTHPSPQSRWTDAGGACIHLRVPSVLRWTGTPVRAAGSDRLSHQSSLKWLQLWQLWPHANLKAARLCLNSLPEEWSQKKYWSGHNETFIVAFNQQRYSRTRWPCGPNVTAGFCPWGLFNHLLCSDWSKHLRHANSVLIYNFSFFDFLMIWADLWSFSFMAQINVHFILEMCT